MEGWRDGFVIRSRERASQEFLPTHLVQTASGDRDRTMGGGGGGGWGEDRDLKLLAMDALQ